MTLINRFLNYVKIDTTSSEESTTSPSTKGQTSLANLLVAELKDLGVKNAFIDEFSYVYGFIKGTNVNKTIALIAHLDTSSDASGFNVKPRVIENYDGQDIILENGLVIAKDAFPRLDNSIGHSLVVTDGTTLLGADDKAGITIIMDLISQIMQHTISEFPNIIITFTPDEEIGEGTAHFNTNFYKEHNCNVAYTIDGAEYNIINFENFNAASAIIEFIGKSIHPGDAKNKMINSQKIAMEFSSMLPNNLSPEFTSDYEGFNHLTSFNGNVTNTTLHYIIRNHDFNRFTEQKKSFYNIMNFINNKYQYEVCKVTIEDSYYNMKDLILKNKQVLRNLEEAFKLSDIPYKYEPIRGGTDGARLTFMGILCPNIGTGGGNFHGPLEYLDLFEMNQVGVILKNLLKITAKE